MENTNKRLEELLINGITTLPKISELELTDKQSPEKWSKKEILGHLVDSAINNLQRFTEIQFEPKPYIIRKYNQVELVKANDYQNAEIKEIVNIWSALNYRILFLINQQTEETLLFQIILPDNKKASFRFLIEDYVVHLEHHLNQIILPKHV